MLFGLNTMERHAGLFILLCFLVTGFNGELQYFLSPCVGDLVPIACESGSSIALSSPMMGAQRCEESQGICCGNVECFYKMPLPDLRSLFEICSGKEKCEFVVPASPTNRSRCTGYDARQSSALINYQCIEDRNIISLCGGQKIGHNVYVQYKTTTSGTEDASCSCVVNNINGGGIFVSAVDLRLLSSVGSYTECYSLDISENCTSIGIPCTEKFLADGKRIVSTTANTIINLGTYGGKGPDAVWLEVRGSSPGDKIEVKCEPRDQYLDLPCPERPSSGAGGRKTTRSGDLAHDSNTTDSTAHIPSPSTNHRPEGINTGLIVGGVCAGLLIVWLFVATFLIVKDRTKYRIRETDQGVANIAHIDVSTDNSTGNATSLGQQHDMLVREIESFWYTELDQPAGSDLPSQARGVEETLNEYEVPDDPNKRSSGNSYVVNGCMYTCVDKSGGGSNTNSGNYDAVETVVERDDENGAHDYFVLHSNRGSGESNVSENAWKDGIENPPFDKETNYPDVIVNAHNVSSFQVLNNSNEYECLSSPKKGHNTGHDIAYSHMVTPLHGAQDSNGYTCMHANGKSNHCRISSTYENTALEIN